uniref:Uncharacterized protein n=1 Tax=Nelumbo nucifera TaxID=4432 RepID=A0A822YL00_NELNU|nr:TPA_asm: hypothetical protein HUJ06_010447 [Nelumbo nucifera]
MEMGPASATPPASAAGGFGGWNSPLPYLFGGIAATLGLIALALLILTCTHRKPSTYSSHETEEKTTKPTSPPPDTEYRVVVLMPGDNEPTFIAKPVSSANISSSDEQV